MNIGCYGLRILYSEARKPDRSDEFLSFPMLLPGATPLMLAIQYRRSAVGRLLLGHGADPNKASSNGSTPLHMAASLGLYIPG